MSIWKSKVSLFLLINSCMGSLILTLFLIAFLAASIRLIFAWFYSSSCYFFPRSFNYLIVMPCFLTPFSQIFIFYFCAFYSRFLSLYFSFILKIYAKLRIYFCIFRHWEGTGLLDARRTWLVPEQFREEVAILSIVGELINSHKLYIPITHSPICNKN